MREVPYKPVLRALALRSWLRASHEARSWYVVQIQLPGWVAVMKDRRIVEQGPASQVFDAPQTGYARELIEAIPGLRVR